MPTIKKFKINHSKNTYSNNPDPLLPTGLQFPIDITNFIDESKLTRILDVPVVFDLGFDYNEKLKVIIIYPVLKISGNYKTIGLGCAGFLPQELQDSQIFWETAIATKYKNLKEISEESTSFTDGKINVSIDYKKNYAAKKPTEEEISKNPGLSMQSLYKCYIDTYYLRLIYSDYDTFYETQIRNKKILDNKVDELLDQAKKDL